MSLAFLLSVFTFFTQEAHPVANLWGAEAVRAYADAGSVEPELGTTSLLFEAAILMGIVLTAVRRWVLPIGALTLIIGLSSALTGAVYDYGGYPVLPVLTLVAPASSRIYSAGGCGRLRRGGFGFACSPSESRRSTICSIFSAWLSTAASGGPSTSGWDPCCSPGSSAGS